MTKIYCIRLYSTQQTKCLRMALSSAIQSLPVVVSGRFLVHKGALRQLAVEGSHNSRASFVSVYLHLFNDLLIISSKKYFTSSSTPCIQTLKSPWD